ncbi:MAG: sigma-70 family RNA polymerase sigma factor [Brumimicrobium sp.]|nr:sigma-70 family RNA polymerase sigma factor [Brumimicrobium sp.]
MTGKRKKYATMNDNELVACYRNSPGNEIIAEIYRRFGHLMMGTCLKYLQNRELSEDTVMEIFESLPRKLQEHNISHFKSWLYMVTKNECLMKLRKKRKDHLDIKEEILEKSYDDNEAELTEKKLNELEEAIADLKDEQQRAIELFYMEQLSYQEVSESMQIPLKKVKSAIQNGKRNLKLKLENNDHFKSA